MAGIGTVLDFAPFADRPHHEHGDNGHTARGTERSDEQAEAFPHPAVALALQRHERVPDHRTGEPAQADGSERNDSHPDRRQRGE